MERTVGAALRGRPCLIAKRSEIPRRAARRAAPNSPLHGDKEVRKCGISRSRLSRCAIFPDGQNDNC